MSVVISGGGPAGMMLGLLLARAGIDVTVLEKHGDFLRDFRGDTVHASTVRLMDELGLGRKFAALPQSRLGNMEIPTSDGRQVRLTDFEGLPTPYNYIAMIPQWDLLNLLAQAARLEPSFTLRMNTTATGLIREGGKVVGVRYRTRDGEEGEIRATLTVAADGRHSALRQHAGLVPQEFPVPFDTWWFRLPRHAAEQAQEPRLIPAFRVGEFALSITRNDYFQIAYFTTKGSDTRLRAEGIERFQARIADLLPQYADRVDQLPSMDDVHLLDVRLNRLRRWYDNGLLLIGDAAHAMSPAGGVGINLAVQDAVAAATLLAEPLCQGRLTTADLAKVQRRRWRPMVILQRVQMMLHNGFFAPVLTGRRVGPPTSVVLATRYLPGFRQLPSRLVALGPRPEHAPAFARRSPAESARA
ncbi:FAD-dependent oxidoreductase [Streptantibioticus ferralitis]|uniref:FAD-dependent oxidoreductase n=1 Tax=Streptantibioticus ferralitis TaxID=236510 RepID=A0ABT5Z4W5_9ACTN|nr:FAD-dependent oxidoreductase [Streptantibioticus ferralitis]MDF2258793.1 FAD-dependent oxidoreductase [Streptantibioticus ferralitis]